MGQFPQLLTLLIIKYPILNLHNPNKSVSFLKIQDRFRSIQGRGNKPDAEKQEEISKEQRAGFSKKHS